MDAGLEAAGGAARVAQGAQGHEGDHDHSPEVVRVARIHEAGLGLGVESVGGQEDSVDVVVVEEDQEGQDFSRTVLKITEEMEDEAETEEVLVVEGQEEEDVTGTMVSGLAVVEEAEDDSTIDVLIACPGVAPSVQGPGTTDTGVPMVAGTGIGVLI